MYVQSVHIAQQVQQQHWALDAQLDFIQRKLNLHLLEIAFHVILVNCVMMQ